MQPAKSKTSPAPKLIMVFGTFDLVHKGHLHFFKQARRLARYPYLIVSVARDVNVKKIKKANSHNPEEKRAQALTKLKLVDKVILGSKSGYIAHIKKIRPDFIALGYDQVAYTKNLTNDLRKAGLKTKVVRLKAFKPHVYKSSLIKNNML